MANPGHYGNLMIRYMVARRLKALNPALVLSNFTMPYWNVSHPVIEPGRTDRTLRLRDEQHVDFSMLSYLIGNHVYDRYEWLGYGQRLEQFPDKDECRTLFSRPDIGGLSVSADCLVCPIRGGEILAAEHPGYTILPVDFYADIVERTGLRPVFVGQTAETPYLAALRARFPKADFVPTMGPLADFQTIRGARNIVVPVSTFAWLAAWLSHADRIVLPIFGLFDPKLFILNNLVPYFEPHYEFYQFPPQLATPVDRLFEAHAEIKGQWRRLEADDAAFLAHLVPEHTHPGAFTI